MTGSNHRTRHYSANATCINKTLFQPNAVTSYHVVELGIALPRCDRPHRLPAPFLLRNHLFNSCLRRYAFDP